jgi:F-type H+-transporting ATPase subunit epsilon
MAEKKIYIEIITPQRIVFKGEVLSLSVPGTCGGFQILYNHAPLFSSLEIGEVRMTAADGAEIVYAVTGGFVEIRLNRVVLLADTAERTDEIDKTRAEAARDRARGRILENNPNTDTERARLALARALNRLRIAAGQAGN